MFETIVQSQREAKKETETMKISSTQRRRTEYQLNALRSLKLLVKKHIEANKKKVNMLGEYTERMTYFDEAFSKIKKAVCSDDIEDTVLSIKKATDREKDQMQELERVMEKILGYESKIDRSQLEIAEGVGFGFAADKKNNKECQASKLRSRYIEESLFRYLWVITEDEPGPRATQDFF